MAIHDKAFQGGRPGGGAGGDIYPEGIFEVTGPAPPRVKPPVEYGVMEIPPSAVAPELELPPDEMFAGHAPELPGGQDLEVAEGITTAPGGTLTDAENRYLAQKYGGPEAGIYGPGEFRGDTFEGGQEVPVEGGGAVGFPKGQGVDLEMMYVLDPEKFQSSFPALIDDKGEFDQSAYKRMQAAKAGIGARPPEGRQAMDYTDAAGFENQLIQRLGLDPMTFNPMAEMEKETTANLPDLFRHIFSRQVSWNDRSSLSDDQNKYWIAVKNAYRAQTLERHKTTHKTAKWAYEQGMKQFHEAAGRALTKQKAAKGAEPKPAKSADWKSERNNLSGDYKFKTLGDVMHQQAAKDITGAAMKVYDRLRKENRFASPLETRMAAKKFTDATIERYWELMKGLNEKDDADKIKAYQDAVKQRIFYVPKTKVVQR